MDFEVGFEVSVFVVAVGMNIAFVVLEVCVFFSVRFFSRFLFSQTPVLVFLPHLSLRDPIKRFSFEPVS